MGRSRTEPLRLALRALVATLAALVWVRLGAGPFEAPPARRAADVVVAAVSHGSATVSTDRGPRAAEHHGQRPVHAPDVFAPALPTSPPAPSSALRAESYELSAPRLSPWAPRSRSSSRARGPPR